MDINEYENIECPICYRVDKVEDFEVCGTCDNKICESCYCYTTDNYVMVCCYICKEEQEKNKKEKEKKNNKKKQARNC